MAVHTIPCVLFAGGKSSCMGKNKSLLPFSHANTLTQYQYERLKKIFNHVYISAKDKRLFSGLESIVIEDVIAQELYAPTAGFVNIFKQLSTYDAFFVLSVDSPFVTQEIIERLLDTPVEKYDAVIVRTTAGIHPLCGIYSRTLEKPIIEMIEKNDHKLGKLLKKSNVIYIDVEDEDAMTNINTPEEYDKALSML